MPHACQNGWTEAHPAAELHLHWAAGVGVAVAPAREASAPGAAAGTQGQAAAQRMAAPVGPGGTAPAGVVAAAEAAAQHQMTVQCTDVDFKLIATFTYFAGLAIPLVNLFVKGMQTSVYTCFKGKPKITWAGQPGGWVCCTGPGAGCICP